MAYLTGRKEFYGLPLQVDAACWTPPPTPKRWWTGRWKPSPLPPRAWPTWAPAAAPLRWPAKPAAHAQVLAVDASADALVVAQANAQRLGLPVRFQHGNWLHGVEGRVRRHRFQPALHPQRRPAPGRAEHEPLQALASGSDGLDDIRTIVAQAPARLAPGGWLLLEHGYDQAEAVQALLVAQGLCRCKAAMTLPASRAVPAGSGRQ